MAMAAEKKIRKSPVKTMRKLRGQQPERKCKIKLEEHYPPSGANGNCDKNGSARASSAERRHRDGRGCRPASLCAMCSNTISRMQRRVNENIPCFCVANANLNKHSKSLFSESTSTFSRPANVSALIRFFIGAHCVLMQLPVAFASFAFMMESPRHCLLSRYSQVSRIERCIKIRFTFSRRLQ